MQAASPPIKHDAAPQKAASKAAHSIRHSTGHAAHSGKAPAPAHGDFEIHARLIDSFYDSATLISPSAGDRFWVLLQLWNKGKSTVVVPIIPGRWSWEAPSSYFYQMSIRDGKGRRVPLTRFGQDLDRPKPSGWPKGMAPPQVETAPTRFAVKPGQYIGCVYPLGLMYDITATGHYVLIIRCRLPNGEVATTRLPFVVELPPEPMPGDPQLPSDAFQDPRNPLKPVWGGQKL